MKRIFFSVFFLLPVILSAQYSVYTIKFDNIDNQEISMSAFTGKKILVVTVDASNPDTNQLSSLDTLYKSGEHNLVVIAIPVEDFGTSLSIAQLQNIFSSQLHLTYLIAKPAKGKKTNGNDQHKLLKWLTNKEDNKHMNRDVEEPGQMFVINEGGSYMPALNEILHLQVSLWKKVLEQPF